MQAISAYLWLLVAAGASLVNGLAALGATVPAIDTDADYHVLGAGFVTLLILGVGARLLPGLGQRTLRSQALVWATFALGNAAALLRVGPFFLPTDAAASLDGALLSLAGLAALAALTVFGLNIAGPDSPRRRPA